MRRGSDPVAGAPLTPTLSPLGGRGGEIRWGLRDADKPGAVGDPCAPSPPLGERVGVRGRLLSVRGR